eukprot:GHVS01001390.1.p1 GENE.GHVS01001390.1~~GHVS01001390.1.p1  ORF type:complete len:141 (+),score=3.46 GHVS01001390.1:254-676(+)
MGFVGVICPLVIAAPLLLLAMVTVTSEAFQVGNTGIYFVSEPLCPKLFVTKPDVATVPDHKTIDHRVFDFSSVGEPFKPVYEIKDIIPQDADADADARSLNTLLMVYVNATAKDKPVPVVWINDESFHINDALVTCEYLL